MANTEFLDYPKGKIAIEGGELKDAFDIQVAFEDGEQDIHTFRNKGMASGSTGGKRAGSVTFKSYIGKNGFERSYLEDWERRKVVQARVKVPGKTFTFTGRYRTPVMGSNLDGAIEFTAIVKGRFSIS